MKPETENALREHCMAVVHCENARAVLSKPLPELSPDELKCATVARHQLLVASKHEKLDQRLRWHVPEPWNGHLATARLLFIGQNPSVNHQEDYPTTWHVQGDGARPGVDQKLLEFFDGRFEAGLGEPPVKDGTKVRLREGGYPSRANRFLEHVAELAKACFGRSVRAGIDYAITEAVKCKAPGPPGVAEATTVCAPKHLTNTLQLSGATVLICLGGEARIALKSVCETSGLVEKHKPFPDNGPFPLGRWHVLFLEHSGARRADHARSVMLAEDFNRYLASYGVSLA